MGKPLLEVQNLVKHFRVDTSGTVKAVDGVTFSIAEGETLGVVGESGSGKTTVGRLILRLLKPTSGEIRYRDAELGTRGGQPDRTIRREISAVFQDPYTSLNPRKTVEFIVTEPIRISGQRTGLRRRGAELLDLVGLGPSTLDQFPNELSGGQRQRVGIARALAMNPKLVILDEPVSALDVSIRAQVLNLLAELQSRLGTAFLLIAHDIAIVRHVSRRVAVMYLGKVMEIGPAATVLRRPSHPYTEALLSAVPRTDPSAPRANRIVLEGDVPSPFAPPSGCRFRTRCWKAQEICAREEPELLMQADPDHAAACHFPAAGKPGL